MRVIPIDFKVTKGQKLNILVFWTLRWENGFLFNWSRHDLITTDLLYLLDFPGYSEFCPDSENNMINVPLPQYHTQKM